MTRKRDLIKRLEERDHTIVQRDETIDRLVEIDDQRRAERDQLAAPALAIALALEAHANVYKIKTGIDLTEHNTLIAQADTIRAAIDIPRDPPDDEYPQLTGSTNTISYFGRQSRRERIEAAARTLLDIITVQP